MVESIVKFGRDALLVGVLTVPEKKMRNNLCVVISNSGLIHKPGPNRLGVRIARQLAGVGVHAFRFDFSGLGDSPLSGVVTNTLQAHIAEIRQAMDKVTQLTGITRFALYGLCSAAELSFKTSLLDERVDRLILVDGYHESGEWVEPLHLAAHRNCSIRYYKKHLFDYRRWRKILSGKSKVFTLKNLQAAPAALFFPVAKKIKKLFRRRPPPCEKDTTASPGASGIDKWNILFNRGVVVQLIYSEGSHYIDLFNQTLATALQPFRKEQQLALHLIKDTDHTFTPVWSQQLLTDLVCTWTIQKNQSI